MKRERLQDLLQQARAAGLLPEEASIPAAAGGRPWPVLILTFCGAMLAAVPLLVFFGMLFGRFLLEGPGTYACGALLMAGGCVVLRAEGVALFIEHLALVALGVGIALLDAAVFRDFGLRAGGVSGALLCFLAAWLIPLNWLRNLLGLAAFGLALSALLAKQHWLRFGLLWDVTATLAAIWLLMLLVQDAMLKRGQPRLAAALEALQAGWLCGVFACFAFGSGQTLLLGGTMGGSMVGALGSLLQDELVRHAGSLAQWRNALAALLPLAVWLWGTQRWALARHWLAVVLALSLALLAWFMPALGVVAAASGLCLLTGRTALAVVGAVAMAWIIGAFYYQLNWPLHEKAQLLCGLGAVLGLAVWLALRQHLQEGAVPGQSGPDWRARACIACGALVSLLVLNLGIWQKEELIAHGRQVFIALAPVDPRSLLQGDYMALNYRLGPELQSALRSVARRARIIARAAVDERGVLHLSGLADPALADGIKVELINKGGRWLVASDAWYFREGEGQKWAAARYAEFRLLPDGRALLVGMADANLQSIVP